MIDHVGGLDDLEARVIRAIGDPDRRLKEDPVRMTRAVHFAARIGGSLEPALREATLRCAPEIAKSSGSRLYAELMKILARGCAAPTLRGLFDLGILEPWLPELGAFLRSPIEWPTAPGGTHEAASAGEPEDTPPSHLTWNLLGAADAWGMGARGVPESLEMSVLLGPWILSEWHSDRRRGHDFWTHAEELFRPMALRMNVPRRTSYEMREILGLQDRLREPPEQKRRQRSIVERSVFPEALAYYQLVLRARGHDLAPVERWRAIADDVWAHERRHHDAPVAHAPTDFAPGADDGPVRDLEEEPLVGEPEAAPRRRGRRGGRRGSQDPEAAPPDADAPIAGIFGSDAPASAPASPPAPTWLPKRLSAAAARPAEATGAIEPAHTPVVPMSAPIVPPVPTPPPVVRAAPPPPPPPPAPPPPQKLPPSDLPFGAGIP